jgi:hypothetical protein
MKEYQIGDEVEFLVIECHRCKTKKPLFTEDSFFFIVPFGQPEGLVCSDCTVSEEERLLSAVEIISIIGDEPLGPPRQGAFKPLPKEGDSVSSEDSPFWTSAGETILETMAGWHGKVLKFTIGSEKHKGLWVKPIWEGSKVKGLQLAGDTPSKGLELDIYQTRRLSQFGFVEEGRSNKIWSLSFQEHEMGVANATAVITYVLRHGYLLDVNEVTSLTPTLDVDFSDPEYQHLRSKG